MTMSRRFGTRAGIALGFAVLALGVPGAFAQTETEHLSQTVRLDPGGTLRLNNISGHVTISGSDRSDVTIDATRRAPRERLARVKLDIHTEGSTVVVEANHHDSRWWDRDHDNVVETELDIRVPRRTNLDLHVFSSPVDVNGVEGSHKIHGFSSPVRLVDVAGPVQAHTFSGRVEIRARAWEPKQTIDVDTFSGSVDLYVPDSAGGSVSFNSFSGRLSSNRPLTFQSSRRRSLEAVLGSDSSAGTMRFKTFSGNVRISK
jgi:hypothetical protein